MDNKDIVKSNALIEACYNPGNVYRMRVLLAALMQIRAKNKISHKQNFIVTANALSDLTGSKAVENYKELKRAAKDLAHMVITIKNTPEGYAKDPWDEMDISVTSSCRYYKNEGKISLRFTDEIIPYISDLKTRFTQYQAKYVMPMRSSYGIRLYELCLQWLGDEREFEVEEFKRLFNLENKYKSIKDLKKRVIEPALNDINRHSDIHVKFGQRKSGRRVTHFQFLIVRKKAEARKKRLTMDEWITKKKKARPGEEWPEARKRLRKEYAQYKKSID